MKTQNEITPLAHCLTLENKMQVEIKVSADTEKQEDRELIEQLVRLLEQAKKR